MGIGNELLLFSIELLICLAHSDGVGVLEHPGEPADETKPSIWRLPIIQFLRQLPGFEFVDFAQGLLGAKSPKPTRFLTLNMASLPRFLEKPKMANGPLRASRNIPQRSIVLLGKVSQNTSWKLRFCMKLSLRRISLPVVAQCMYRLLVSTLDLIFILITARNPGGEEA